jgi:hypothetical protein
MRIHDLIGEASAMRHMLLRVPGRGYCLNLGWVPEDYPNADAREWESFKRDWMAIARGAANISGRICEVYDHTGNMIEQVYPQEPDMFGA